MSYNALRRFESGSFSGPELFLDFLQSASRLASEVDAQGNAGIVNLSLYIPPCMCVLSIFSSALAYSKLLFRLEIICRVGFGRDFGYESPDAQAILGSWREDVQKFSTFAAFLAPIVIGMFPWIAKLPIAALQEDGIAKKVIQRVTGDLLKQPSSPDGSDILSILVRESWSGKDDSSSKLSSQQLLDNVSQYLLVSYHVLTYHTDYDCRVRIILVCDTHKTDIAHLQNGRFRSLVGKCNVHTAGLSKEYKGPDQTSGRARRYRTRLKEHRESPLP